VEGFWCQVPSEPRSGLKRPKHMPDYRWHLSYWPDNGGTMPGKNLAFITHVDPISPPLRHLTAGVGWKLVEAPGTAPGSATSIPQGHLSP